jgi:hypothetical protein
MRPCCIDVDCRIDEMKTNNIINIKPFTEYIKKLLNISDSDEVGKVIYLARFKENDLHILTDSDEFKEKILQLPDTIGPCFPMIADSVINATETPIDDEKNDVNHLNKSLSTKEARFNLDILKERVEEEANNEDLMQLYYRYLEQRKWKGYKKLLNPSGGVVGDDEIEIGPVIDITDLSNARVASDLIMPIIRILDPWSDLYNSTHFIVKDLSNIKELLTFRKETWLDDRASEGFIMYLNEESAGFYKESYVLSPTVFNLMVQSPEQIATFIKDLPSECFRILIYTYVGDHYVVVEIEVPTAESKTVNVIIADSLDQTLDDLIEDVCMANIDLLASSFNPYHEINYIKADDVPRQQNNYDCGVCCLQRIYFWKRFNVPKPTNEYAYLLNTNSFRVFCLATILDFHRKDLSPVVYYDSPLHKNKTYEGLLSRSDTKEATIPSLEQEKTVDTTVEKQIPPHDLIEGNVGKTVDTTFEKPNPIHDLIEGNVATEVGPQDAAKFELSKSKPKHKSVSGKAYALVNEIPMDEGSNGDETEHEDDPDPDTDTDNQDTDTDNDQLAADENQTPNAETNDEQISDDDSDNEQYAMDVDPGEKGDSDYDSGESVKNTSHLSIERRQSPRKKAENTAIQANDLTDAKKSLPPLKVRFKLKRKSDNASTDAKSRKKQVYGKRQTLVREKEIERKRKIKETQRKQKLQLLNDEMERWDEWHEVSEDMVEIDLFTEDPNYFVNKKLKNADQELLKNPERWKTKLYEPKQYDFERAKKWVEDKHEKSFGQTKEKLASAVKILSKFHKEKIDKSSSKYQMQKKKVEALKQQVKLCESTIQTEAELLPYDSVYALRARTDNTGAKKEYFAIAKNPDGSYKEKLVTREWIQINCEKDFVDRFFQTDHERGWILFSEDDAQRKVVKDNDELQNLLNRSKVEPIYQYQRKEDDDRIHCIRIAVDFKHPYKALVPNTIKFAIMTEKHSSKNSPIKNNPWLNKDENGNTSHVYWDCKEIFIRYALGDQFFEMIIAAIQETWSYEFRMQGRPYKMPQFFFDDNPRYEFLPDTTRFLDNCDYVKESHLRNKPKVFNPDFCGIFSNRQYYYIDLREFQTRYYINVSTKQICGICYRPAQNQWIGLEKKRETGINQFKNVELDENWVKTNIDKRVIAAAKQKALNDDKKFLKLPIGLGRPLQTSKEIQKNPTISYLQYGEDTCVFASICSALHYLEYEDVALQVDKYKQECMENSYFESFENLMGKVTSFLHDKSWPYFRQISYIKKISDPEKFDLIEEATKNPNILFHVVLVSKDGGENHSVCVINNWIFDGNYTNARKLSQANLDASCGMSQFLGIARGYKYIFSTNLHEK